MKISLWSILFSHQSYPFHHLILRRFSELFFLLMLLLLIWSYFRFGIRIKKTKKLKFEKSKISTTLEDILFAKNISMKDYNIKLESLKKKFLKSFQIYFIISLIGFFYSLGYGITFLVYQLNSVKSLGTMNMINVEDVYIILLEYFLPFGFMLISLFLCLLNLRRKKVYFNWIVQESLNQKGV